MYQEDAMDIRPITNDRDHEEALREIDRLWGAELGTPDGDKLDALVALVVAYEDRRWPIKDFKEPISYLKTAMEVSERTQTDLAKLLGSRSHASEILSRRRALSIEHIRKLVEKWALSPEVLVKPYRLTPEKTKVKKARKTVRKKERCEAA
jgi:HTH-type transcriptional regulator/antitoxin HigA